MSSFSSTYPAIRPTYQIDFSNGGRIPPNATFSRADSPIDATKAAASAVHFWSNEKHLSSENLLTPSTPDSSWVRARLTPTYSQTGPYTGANATLHTEQAVTNTAYLGSQNYTTVANTSYTYSVWVKQNTGSRNYYQLRVGGLGAGVPFVTYHLSGAGSIDEFGGSYLDSYSITAGPTGWYKLTMTITPTSAATTTYFFLCVAAPSGGEIPSITGDTGNSFLVFGAQVSSTGESVLNETTTSIHRQYASTLKSVSTAGQPRFEYGIDGQSAGTSLGILVEGQTTNLLPNGATGYNLSNAFSWNKINANVVQNAAIAPTGELEATHFYEDTATATQQRFDVPVTVSAAAHTLSGYFKSAGRDEIIVRVANGGTNYWGKLTFSTETTSDAGNPFSSLSVTSVGNGWYRFTATTPTLTAGSTTIYINLSNGALNYDGDGYSGVLFYGLQFEAGAASSVIATSGGAATRAADSLSVDLTQAGFNGGPSSVVVEMDGGAGDFPSPFCVSDGSTSNQYRCFRNSATATSSTDYRFRYYVDGTSYVNRTASSSNAAAKIGMSVDTNSVITCFDGGNSSTDTSAPLVTMTQLDVGGFPGSVTQKFDGTCKRIAVYGTALSQTELEALTS
jgi:hypothetical protein